MAIINYHVTMGQLDGTRVQMISFLGRHSAGRRTSSIGKHGHLLLAFTMLLFRPCSALTVDLLANRSLNLIAVALRETGAGEADAINITANYYDNYSTAVLASLPKKDKDDLTPWAMTSFSVSYPRMWQSSPSVVRTFWRKLPEDTAMLAKPPWR